MSKSVVIGADADFVMWLSAMSRVAQVLRDALTACSTVTYAIADPTFRHCQLTRWAAFRDTPSTEVLTDIVAGRANAIGNVLQVAVLIPFSYRPDAAETIALPTRDDVEV